MQNEKMQEGEMLHSKDCNDSFTADVFRYLFLRRCCVKQNSQNESALFKEGYRCTEMLSLFSKTHCCFDSLLKKFILGSKIANN